MFWHELCLFNPWGNLLRVCLIQFETYSELCLLENVHGRRLAFLEDCFSLFVLFLLVPKVSSFVRRTAHVASSIHRKQVAFSGFLDMNSANDSARWDIQLYSPLVTWHLLFLLSSCSTLPRTIFQSYLRSILSFLRGQL